MTTTYVDTSTLLKYVLDEDGTQAARRIWDEAEDLAAVELIRVEARAALAAARRARRITVAGHEDAKAEVADLVGDLSLVSISARVLQAAGDLAESEALRGYDAVHLAAALEIEAAVLTSADAKLCTAAERRGLHVANPLDE